MDKEKYFINKVYELCEKTRIKKPHVISRDNRMGQYIAGVTFCSQGYEMIYNMKRMKYTTKNLIIMIILHELGHIKKGEGKDKIETEYIAQKFAMNSIKKYYPKKYIPILKFIYKHYTNHHNKIYKQSFGKLAKELLGEYKRRK